MRIAFFAVTFVIFTTAFVAPITVAQAQSSAAMQVCADILAQYGIAPEGCDPQDDVYKKPKDEAVVKVASVAPALLSQTQQELNENNIFFRKGGDKLDAQAIQKLDTLGQILNTSVLNSACLRLVGHSDASGPANLNAEMGLKRAKVVAQYLRPILADTSRIQEVMSDGETNTIQGIEPENALNRRVTIYARKCPTP